MRSSVDAIRVIPTGGDAFEMAREQWDDGNNVVCLEPGVVVAYERNVDTNTRLRKAGHRGDHDRRLRARPRARRLALHDLPDRARRRVLIGAMSTTCATGSFLKELDFTPRRAAAPAAALAGAQDGQVRGHRDAAARRQGDRADLREDLDPHALRVRGRRASTRARTSPTSIRPARRWATRSRSPTRRACSGGCTTRIEYRGSGQERRRGARRLRRRPGLQRADRRMAPDADARRLPDHARVAATGRSTRSPTRSWATGASTWAARCWSRARSSAPTCASSRPPELRPPDDVVALAETRRRGLGRAHHDHRRPGAGVAGRRLRPHRRLGLDGRAEGRLGRARAAARAVPGQRRR